MGEGTGRGRGGGLVRCIPLYTVDSYQRYFNDISIPNDINSCSPQHPQAFITDNQFIELRRIYYLLFIFHIHLSVATLSRKGTVAEPALTRFGMGTQVRGIGFTSTNWYKKPSS